MDSKLLERLKKTTRYKDFIFLDEAKPFCEIFKNKNFSSVQVHDMTEIGPYESEEENYDISPIVGFAGVCSWKNNILASLDGDSYTKDMSVWGYHTFISSSSGNECLDILSDDW